MLNINDYVLTEKNLNEFSHLINKTLDSIFSSIKDDTCFSGINPYVLRKQVEELEILPENGLGYDAVLKKLEEVVLPNMLRTWSTSYMPHLHSPALLESIASELIISVFNNSLDSWDQGPSSTEIEVKVIEKLLSLFGYEDGDGTFTSGGSASNLSAIVVARDNYCTKVLKHDCKKEGLPDCYKRFKLYTSEISHFSMDKSSHLLGLGYNSVGKLKVNDKCQIDVTAAAAQIEKDVQDGFIPYCLVATLGTTDFGSIDNVEELRKICDKYNMHLHADAAYGSGVIMSSKYSSRLGKISLCDSITIDFHKMFLLPISCSCVLTKDKTALDCFELHADYLNREEDEADGYINLVSKSIQTTRRSDALKVYISFATRGKDGYENIINTAVENAQYFYNRILEDESFTPAVKPELSSVVFRLNKSDDENKRVRRALMEKGRVIGQTVKDGLVMLKFTLLNPLLDKNKIDLLIQEIKSI